MGRTDILYKIKFDGKEFKDVSIMRLEKTLKNYMTMILNYTNKQRCNEWGNLYWKVNKEKI